jgi:hypothetical protein
MGTDKPRNNLTADQLAVVEGIGILDLAVDVVINSAGDILFTVENRRYYLGMLKNGKIHFLQRWVVGRNAVETDGHTTYVNIGMPRASGDIAMDMVVESVRAMIFPGVAADLEIMTE